MSLCWPRMFRITNAIELMRAVGSKRGATIPWPGAKWFTKAWHPPSQNFMKLFKSTINYYITSICSFQHLIWLHKCILHTSQSYRFRESFFRRLSFTILLFENSINAFLLTSISMNLSAILQISQNFDSLFKRINSSCSIENALCIKFEIFDNFIFWRDFIETLNFFEFSYKSFINFILNVLCLTCDRNSI